MARRKLTPAEKEARKHQRSADRKNAKIAATVPLFADVLPKHTPEGEYWHHRRKKAQAADDRGVGTAGLGRPLMVLHWLNLRHLGREHLAPDVFAKLDAYIRTTYPAVD